MYGRRGMTIAVPLSRDEQLTLAAALEMYPSAVTINAWADGGVLLPTIYHEGPTEAEDTFTVDMEAVEWWGIVRINWRDAGLHLEQAPDEWSLLDASHTSHGYVMLMRTVNHVPSFAPHE